MEKEKKLLLSIISIVLVSALVILIFIFGLFQFSFSSDGACGESNAAIESFDFSNNVSFLGYSAVSYSNTEFGEKTQNKIDYPHTKVNYQNNLVSENSILVNSYSKTWASCGFCGDGVKNIATYIVTDNLNINSSNLENISFSYNSLVETKYYDVIRRSGYNSISLYNEKEEIVIFRSEEPSTTAGKESSISNSGQILINRSGDDFILTIGNKLENLKLNGVYNLRVFSVIRGGCSGHDIDSISSISINDLVIEKVKPICVQDSSCASNICSTKSCSDVCGNVYLGTQDCSDSADLDSTTIVDIEDKSSDSIKEKNKVPTILILTLSGIFVILFVYLIVYLIRRKK